MFLKPILEKLESLEHNELPRVVEAEAACTEANIEEFEDTIHTADDLAFELVQAKQAVLKKYNFLENQIVARSITNLMPEQLEEFESAFRHFAKDQSNNLTKDEFNACLQALGVAYSVSYNHGFVSKQSELTTCQDEEFENVFSQVSRNKIWVNFEQVTSPAFIPGDCQMLTDTLSCMPIVHEFHGQHYRRSDERRPNAGIVQSDCK